MADALAVEAHGLEKAFRGRKVLHGVDLQVPRGTVLALLGPNGAGKTTTVRILATLLRPDAGSVRVLGLDAVADRRRVRAAIGLTGQYAAVDELQTGEENLWTIARLRGLSAADARSTVRQLLERFGLETQAGRRVGTYSGGTRRRLDLAAGLVGRPSVVFLDEPTTGLDVRSRQATWDTVRELVAQGVTVLLTTQYLEEADRLADAMALLEDGRVVAHGTATELKQRVVPERLELTLRDAGALDAALSVLDARVLRVDVDRRTLEVATDGTAAHVRALLDEIDPRRDGVERFATRGATLDDVFLALTGSDRDRTPEEALRA